MMAVESKGCRAAHAGLTAFHLALKNPIISHSKLKPSMFSLPEVNWNISALKEEGLYFNHISIKKYLDNAWVEVEDHGKMLMLSSYSYLGLYDSKVISDYVSEVIHQYGTGTGGSRLLAGQLAIHQELEKKLAKIKGTEDAILFTSGFSANYSTIVCLLRRGDVVLGDKSNHASIVDGCLASQAEFVRFRHNDLEDLSRKLQQHSHAKRKLVVIDAVFSMDGDIAPLPAIVQICKEHQAILMVDEAHSLGVLGKTGRGIEEYFGLDDSAIQIKMGTLSKAIPSSGGYIASSKNICEFIRHEARSYIYSGSLSPSLTGAAIRTLELLFESPNQILKKLWDNVQHFRSILDYYQLDYGQTQTPIIPIMIGDHERTQKVARYCQNHGLFINAIIPPVVPVGSSRLRASIMANHQKDDLTFAAKTIRDAMDQHP